MSFGDDIDDIGFDLGEEESLAVLTFVFINDFGQQVKIRKEIPSIDVYPSIYIEQDDKTVHSKFLGYGPDGKKYFKYVANYRKEAFRGALYPFLDNDWYIIYDSEESL
mgnify:CR=1 FL=1